MSCHFYVKRACLVLSRLSPLMCWCSFVKACGELDPVSAAGRAMTTKRKAENHTRAGNLPVIMKPGGSQADSERDSGFSGLVTLLHIKNIEVFLKMTFNLNWTPINPFRLIYRCELRAHEHDGHHRFWGFTTPCCTAGTTDHWLTDPPFWTCSGGWALSHDHHEQCPAQAGNLGKGLIIKPQYSNEKKKPKINLLNSIHSIKPRTTLS